MAKKDNVKENPDGSVTIDLAYPFKWGKEEGDTVKQLNIPRIKAQHMRGINGKKLETGDMDEVLGLIQKLLGEPKSYIDSIDMEDIQTIGEVLGDFLPSGPTTGGTV